MQDDVQMEIEYSFGGLLPVGSAVMVRTGVLRTSTSTSASIMPSWLVYAPTMRAPGDVSSTYNAYLAFRAALLKVVHHNQHTSTPPADRVSLLVCPSMCTGAGMMSHRTSAAQMRLVWDDVMATSCRGRGRGSGRSVDWRMAWDSERTLKATLLL